MASTLFGFQKIFDIITFLEFRCLTTVDLCPALKSVNHTKVNHANVTCVLLTVASINTFYYTQKMSEPGQVTD